MGLPTSSQVSPFICRVRWPAFSVFDLRALSYLEQCLVWCCPSELHLAVPHQQPHPSEHADFCSPGRRHVCTEWESQTTREDTSISEWPFINRTVSLQLYYTAKRYTAQELDFEILLSYHRQVPLKHYITIHSLKHLFTAQYPYTTYD